MLRAVACLDLATSSLLGQHNGAVQPVGKTQQCTLQDNHSTRRDSEPARSALLLISADITARAAC